VAATRDREAEDREAEDREAEGREAEGREAGGPSGERVLVRVADGRVRGCRFLAGPALAEQVPDLRALAEQVPHFQAVTGVG
jgi:hypothetical protein